MFQTGEQVTQKTAREEWNEYLEAYSNWAEQWERILLHNQQIVTTWQAENDTLYRVYRLIYAIAPAGWSSMGKTERASVWSLTSAPDEEGYWMVIERGYAVRRRYQMWISVDAGIPVRPSTEGFGFTLFSKNALMNVYLHPFGTRTAEELEKELELTPLPREPAQPFELYSRLYPELRDDLDFGLPHDLARHEYNRQREAQGLEPFVPENYETESWEV